MEIAGGLVDPRARVLLSVVMKVRHEAALRILMWMLEAEVDLVVEVTIADLAERMGCSKVYAHRMVTMLCDLGLVCPETSARRGRSRAAWLLSPPMFLRRGGTDAAGAERIKERFDLSMKEYRQKGLEKARKAELADVTPEPIVVPNEDVRELEALKSKVAKGVRNARSKVGC